MRAIHGALRRGIVLARNMDIRDVHWMPQPVRLPRWPPCPAVQRGAHRDPEWTLGECRRSAADDLHDGSPEEIDDQRSNVSERRGRRAAL